MSDNLNIEPVRCPRCGKEPRAECFPTFYSDVDEGWTARCQCEDNKILDVYVSEDQAVRDWNQRAKIVRLRKQVEALEAALAESHEVLLDVMKTATRAGVIGGEVRYDTKRWISYEDGAEYLERCGLWAGDDSPEGYGRFYHDVKEARGC